jgi:Tol biopolymer transport system component
MMKLGGIVVTALVGSATTLGAGSAAADLAAPALGAAGTGAEVCSQLAWEGSDGSIDQIWVADADGANRTEISTAGPDPDPIANRRTAWSPDGTRIAWDGLDGASYQVWVADPDGTNRTALSTIGPDPDPVSNLSPTWSPDGTRIAWAGFIGTTFQIWVADADGTDRIEISSVGPDPDPVSNRNPAWSPDGTRIAWEGNDGTTRRVYVSDADGTDRIEISSVGQGSDPTDNSEPTWSPDGTRIAWWGLDAAALQVWVADADGTNRIELSTVDSGIGPTSSFSPAWSPDGARIAWVGSIGATEQVWVADVDGTNRTEISTIGPDPDPTSNRRPAWSPDGTRLAWDGNDGTTRQVYASDADGTGRTEISTVGTGPYPTDNGRADWRSWRSELSLTTTSSGFEVGQTATASATVTNAGPCPSVAIVITGLALPCVTSPVVSATAGSVTGSNWTVASLNPGATATATVTGTAASGSCSSTLSLAAAPATAGPVNARLGGNVCPTSTTGFTDVSATSFAAADIACIFGLGITTGTSATTYTPAGNVTREQMAAFLARLWRSLGNTCPSGSTGFTDVPTSSFAAADIACIFGLGITTGTTPTTYTPTGNVTREQMAAFIARLWRSLGNTCPTGPTGFTDIPTSSFAAADIACIKGLDITTGTTATTYTPTGNVTREQMAAFLARLWRIA